MYESIPVAPLATPSIVGFAEAALLVPDVAEDLLRRLAANDARTIPSGVIDDLGPMLSSATHVANSLHFRFRLTTIDTARWHVFEVDEGPVSIPGLDSENVTRKLTLVLPLRGSADIRFPSVDKDRELKLGTLAMFPSFLHNEVRPEPGFLAIVGHADGPSFT